MISNDRPINDRSKSIRSMLSMDEHQRPDSSNFVMPVSNRVSDVVSNESKQVMKRGQWEGKVGMPSNGRPVG